MNERGEKCSLKRTDFEAFRDAVDRAVTAYILNSRDDANPSDKTGGVLLYRSNLGVKLHAGVGTFNKGSLLYGNCLSSAMKIVEQLHKRVAITTSCQNRNLEKGLQGGGLNIFCCGQVALSEFPILVSEACLIFGLVQCDLVSNTLVRQALKIGGNTALYERICKKAYS